MRFEAFIYAEKRRGEFAIMLEDHINPHMARPKQPAVGVVDTPHGKTPLLFGTFGEADAEAKRLASLNKCIVGIWQYFPKVKYVCNH